MTSLGWGRFVVVLWRLVEDIVKEAPSTTCRGGSAWVLTAARQGRRRWRRRNHSSRSRGGGGGGEIASAVVRGGVAVTPVVGRGDAIVAVIGATDNGGGDDSGSGGYCSPLSLLDGEDGGGENESADPSEEEEGQAVHSTGRPWVGHLRHLRCRQSRVLRLGLQSSSQSNVEMVDEKEDGWTCEDLRQCDDAMEDYFRDKLRMSPRVFREIVEALLPLLQRRVTFYREPLQPDQIVPYVLYRWASGETYESSTCNFGISRASGLVVVRDVVVELDLRVLDVFVGYPGSCPDVSIHLSSLWARAEAGELFTGPPVMLPFGVPTNGFLLGNNGYPPSEWIVVPYGTTTRHPSKTRFDNQKTARGAVERAFDRLKGMWRLFLQSHKTNMETLPQQFVVVCIFHNLLIEADIPFDDNLLWEVDANGVRRREDLWNPVSLEAVVHGELDAGSVPNHSSFFAAIDDGKVASWVNVIPQSAQFGMHRGGSANVMASFPILSVTTVAA
ncbi:hypothetical protein CBR_g44390 [Chara braunii]|uniref:DDE Tnp4 domain-containing protein n=1 Tax=Chara braunii TaxID=69332 RepID=A0A388LX86_CHABU|nr:hypothetical protein CBR_g44390 [Chara braunii]|eukprot:GBG86937.1 hypothetical protein CBR_g44390 [Chara braunii]